LAGLRAAVPLQHFFVGDGDCGGVTIVNVALFFIVDGDVIFVGHFACAEQSVVLDARYDRDCAGFAAQLVVEQCFVGCWYDLTGWYLETFVRAEVGVDEFCFCGWCTAGGGASVGDA
jgi:hypothetical protein